MNNPTCIICLDRLEEYYGNWLKHCKADHHIGDYLPFYMEVKESLDKEHELPSENEIYKHLDLALKEFDEMVKYDPKVQPNLIAFRNQLVAVAVRLCYAIGSIEGFNS